MADSNIQLNTDGTGKKLDTRTESTNNEHRQVFVLGDPTSNAGVAPVDATNGVTVQGSATGTPLPVATAAGAPLAQESGGNLAALVTSNAGLANPNNPATVTDSTLQNLVDQLAHLSQSLRFLTQSQDVTGQLRVVLGNGTGSTLTTLTNISQIQGFGISSGNPTGVNQIRADMLPHNFATMAWGVLRDNITTS